MKCSFTGLIQTVSLSVCQTIGATDWETFQIGSRIFLAVANGQKLYRKGQSTYNLNSTIYELNMVTMTFLPFQDILTYRCAVWQTGSFEIKLFSPELSVLPCLSPSSAPWTGSSSRWVMRSFWWWPIRMMGRPTP